MLESLSLAQSNSGSGGVAGMLVLVIWLAIIVLILAGSWKMFVKAGQPGFITIIPIVNLYFLLRIVGRPWWWLVLSFIPVVNLVITVIVMLDLAKSFGKGVGFAIGLFLLTPIFVCILGFGIAQYQGPAAA